MQGLTAARRLDRKRGTAAGPFRLPVGEAAWKTLPRAIQARFARVLAPGESAAYLGEIASTRMSVVGWCWAQGARLAGAPLPLKALERTSAAVLVTEDTHSNAEMWTRLYHEAGRLRLRIPAWLTPGHIKVVHREERAGRFSFALTVTHPWFGEMIHQIGFFRDVC